MRQCPHKRQKRRDIDVEQPGEDGRRDGMDGPQDQRWEGASRRRRRRQEGASHLLEPVEAVQPCPTCISGVWSSELERVIPEA